MAADQQLVRDVEPGSGGFAGDDLEACGSGHLGELYPVRNSGLWHLRGCGGRAPAVVCRGATMASLWVMSGPLAGQSVGVTGELVIGRENADLTIDDAEVSRRHVSVRLEGGQLEVKDLGSANGTFVNGSRIDGPVKVGGGAKIRIGQTEFEVRGVLPTRA